jgi:hypothetical protein
MIDQPTAEGALAALEPLVGEWRLTAVAAGGEPWPGEARPTFEWHPSHAHLVQTASISVPGAPDSISIIGCDGANGTYYQLYSDERGVCRVFEMSISETEWTLWREGAPFAQRFTGRFEDGGNKIAGRWERSDDGVNYATDFELTYLRVD